MVKDKDNREKNIVNAKETRALAIIAATKRTATKAATITAQQQQQLQYQYQTNIIVIR